MRQTTLLSAALACASLPAQDDSLAIGEPAPALRISRWLDGAPPFAVGGGRAAMLVFWAPWCGSCVVEFPHLNALVAELADEPITLVSITGDPAEKVEALLASRPLHTRVAFDDGGATFSAYGVRVLPRIVLVDADGHIAALPPAGAVDAGVLRRLIAGDDLDLPVARSRPADLEWDERGAPFDAVLSVAHAILERSDAASGGMRFPPNHGRITGDGVGFGNLIQIAFDARHDQIAATHPGYDDFDDRYRVSVKAPDDRPETARAMLRALLGHTFAFEAEWTEIEEPTPVLRRIAGRELRGLTPSTRAKSGGGARMGEVAFEKVAIGRIAEAIGMFALGRAMVDETGLEGDYDVCLRWTPGDRESFASALAECGLEYALEPRRVRKLRLAPRN